MNIKKILVKSFVGVSVLSALLTTGISTYAKDVIREFSTSDFDSSYTYYGDYSSMYCATNGTSLTSTNSNYDEAYK